MILDNDAFPHTNSPCGIVWRSALLSVMSSWCWEDLENVVISMGGKRDPESQDPNIWCWGCIRAWALIGFKGWYTPLFLGSIVVQHSKYIAPKQW